MSFAVERALALVKELVEARAGLAPPRWVLDARVAERAEARHVKVVDYAQLLRADAAELDALLGALRVGETRFFRHAPLVRALERRVLPALVERGGVIRAWSAGCATGEEAWSLALMLDASGAREWSLLGTDLSPAAIEEARACRDAAERSADLNAVQRARLLDDELRGRVRFAVGNLLDELPCAPESMDLIVCCNVLIYFSEAARRAVIARLASAIAIGGFLVLAPGESARGERALIAERDEGGAVVYRRGTERREQEHEHAHEHVDVHEQEQGERVLRLVGSYEDLGKLREELRAALVDGTRVVDLDGAEFLDEGAARILAQTLEAGHGSLTLRATRSALRHFCARFGLAVA